MNDWLRYRPLRGRPPRRSLVDLLADDVRRDLGDAPVVCLEADVMADEMERYAPTAQEPSRV